MDKAVLEFGLAYEQVTGFIDQQLKLIAKK